MNQCHRFFSRGAASASYLVAVRAGGLLAGFGAMVVAARVLGPEKLGQSSAALATLVAASLAVTCSQDIGLVRSYAAESAEGRARLWGGVLGARLLSGAVVFAALAGVWAMLGRATSAPLWAGMVVSFLALVAAPGWALQAEGRIGALTALTALQSGANLALYAAFLSPGSAVGTDLLLGGTGAAVLAVAFTLGVGRGAVMREVGWALVRPAACLREYARRVASGRALLATGVLTYSMTASDALLVGWLGTAEQAGVYRVAGVAALVVAAFSSLYTTALYPELIEAAKAGPAGLRARQADEERRLLRVWIPAAPVVLASVAVLLPWLFGEGYRGAVMPALWLAGAKLLTFWNGVHVWSLWAEKRDGVMLRVLGISAAVGLGVNTIAVFAGRTEFFGAGTWLAEAIVLVWSRRLARTGEGERR